ncbi:MAG: hypothetical protein ACI9TO_000459, partial [Rickettsiales bacterium]
VNFYLFLSKFSKFSKNYNLMSKIIAIKSVDVNLLFVLNAFEAMKFRRL